MTPAGVEWCSRFPTSRSLDDLVEPFRTSVRMFTDDLRARGCTVAISATRRPYERAWLMHWAWAITDGTRPEDVPKLAGVDIAWTVEGAMAMVQAYRMRYPASLTSRHIAGRAIDMTVGGWTGTGEELFALGARYGVHKLRSDPPHWSDDGR